MGWQYVNSLVKKGYGDHPETQYSQGYLIGTDDEAGLYCFSKSPYFNKPFISDTFLPKITVDSPSYDNAWRIQPFTYNDEKVWANTSSSGPWIFKAKTQGGDWVHFTQRREPYYYTDIDETTVLGDQFYKGPLPDLNGDPEEWPIQGRYSSWEAGSSIQVRLMQNVWVWQYNGEISLDNSKLCGMYLNSVNQTWKYVGVPQWKAVNTTSQQQGYYTNEVFARSWEKDGDDRNVYVSEQGHTIKYDGTQWILGTENSGKWSIGDSEPSMQNAVHFTGWIWDEGFGARTDPRGDFDLNLAGLVPGDKKNIIYMGEASLWRRQTTTL